MRYLIRQRVKGLGAIVVDNAESKVHANRKLKSWRERNPSKRYYIEDQRGGTVGSER